MQIEDWFALIMLLLILFAPELLLWMVGWGFAGMMETSRSRLLVHSGVALALFGPLLIAGCFVSAWLFRFFGLNWMATPLGITAVLMVPGWVIAGVVLGFTKAWFDDRHDPARLARERAHRAEVGQE